MTYLLQIIAPHFVAGCEVNGQRVVRAAPILRWTLGKRPQDVIAWIAKKGYQYDALPA